MVNYAGVLNICFPFVCGRELYIHTSLFSPLTTQLPLGGGLHAEETHIVWFQVLIENTRLMTILIILFFYQKPIVS